jgi:hypothetical protein
MVLALTMPRSAMMQTRLSRKRSRSRVTTGIRPRSGLMCREASAALSVVTSAVLPGHISLQIGRPFSSMTTPSQRFDNASCHAETLLRTI